MMERLARQRRIAVQARDLAALAIIEGKMAGLARIAHNDRRIAIKMADLFMGWTESEKRLAHGDR